MILKVYSSGDIATDLRNGFAFKRIRDDSNQITALCVLADLNQTFENAGCFRMNLPGLIFVNDLRDITGRCIAADDALFIKETQNRINRFICCIFVNFIGRIGIDRKGFCLPYLPVIIQRCGIIGTRLGESRTVNRNPASAPAK